MPRFLCVSCAVTVFVSACMGVGTATAQSVGVPPGDGRAVFAIIPFRNISGESSDVWIGAGIAETLMADLQGAATVEVISREAVSEAMNALGFTGEVPVGDAAVLELGRRLSARWLVTGGYQRLGDQLRITARLVDAATGAVARSAKIDGAIDDLFGLQDRIAAELVADDGTATDAARASLPPASRAGPTPPPIANAATARERSSPSAPPVRRSVRLPPPAAVAAPLPALSQVVGDPEPGAVSGIGSTVRISGLAVVGVIDGPPPPMPPAVINRDERGRATIRAIKLTEGIRLDGQLDEQVYRTVPAVTGFVQQEPDEGARATEQTEVWVMFDSETIYIAARCWNSQPDRIVANEMKRDSFGMFGNETFSVVLDTFYDRRNAFNFMTNALGGLFDATITDERTPNMDWNTVWDVRTGRFDQGWTLEIAIPFKSLRYRSGPAQVWGINVQRRVAWKNEASFLTPIPASLGYAGMFQLSAAATLVGLEVPSSGTRLEIKPYAISDLTTDLNADPPLSNSGRGDFGVDAKFGVTQGLTADLTYNTDFAQVEVDEQQVNLTRFSLFFPEKREFFLEGQGIFDFGGGFRGSPSTFFFTGDRFGGSAPVLFFSRRIGLEDGRTVPIRGGGRLTGKSGPFSIGVLNVQTGAEAVSGAVPTNFSVARLKRDVLRRSAVGALFTARSVSTEGDGGNYVYGVDGLFSFYDNLNLNTYFSRTETPGLHGDDSSYQTQLDYTGDRWGVVLERLAVGANFRPEIGFVRRDDFRRNFASFRYSPRPQAIASVRKLSWEGSIDYTTDGAGLLETRVQQGVFGTEFENGDRFFVGVTDNYEFLKRPFEIAREVTIPVGGYSFLNTRVVYSLGLQRVMSGGLTFERGEFFGGDKTSIGYFRGRIGLSPQLAVEPSISLNWVDLPQGRFTTELVATRATYTLTPRMFVAAFLQFNSGNDALSTNIRLRWEYRPGSELFVVYTDERDTLVPGFPTLENRAFVVKINRLFRF